MNITFKELIDNSFLLAAQIEFDNDSLKAHDKGFKSNNRVIVFPNEWENGDNFMESLKRIHKSIPYKSLALALISKELYCNIFDISEEEYNRFIEANSHEECVNEEFGWFNYWSYTCDYYRIPKELVLGTLLYGEDNDLLFVRNNNYYLNLEEKDRDSFINCYKKIILKEIRNKDEMSDYPFEDIYSLIPKELELK